MMLVMHVGYPIMHIRSLRREYEQAIPVPVLAYQKIYN
jgi:hypothetical protein